MTPIHRRFHTIPAAVALVAALAASGCVGAPPALLKAELDAGKLPKKHPKLTAEQTQAGCRSCHKEQPPIKQPAKP